MRRRLIVGIWKNVSALVDLLVVYAIHLIFASYLFSKVVGADFSRFLWGSSESNNKGVLEGDKKLVNEGSSSGDVVPIVLVHGIFGFGEGRLGCLSYFAGAEELETRVLVPDLGALSSIHDRARELFYYLKGGQVDYGEEHSQFYGHSRFGRVYARGRYPEWDEEHPVHFVGHSAGSQVVRLLQQMLADKAFKDYENTSEDWVLSVTSVSGPLNGSTRTNLDGMNVKAGNSFKTLSLLQLCRIGITILDWLDIPLLKNYYTFGFDHFGIVASKVGISGLVNCLLLNSGPFACGDWIVPDLTIEGALKLNSNLKTFPNTFYFSYATIASHKYKDSKLTWRIFDLHPLLIIRVLQMMKWRYPTTLLPPYKGYRDEDWWENDGAVNTISMIYPHIPTSHPNQFVSKESELLPLQPGIWYYKIIEADHFFYVIDKGRAGSQFELFYNGIYHRCRKRFLRPSQKTSS